jgi:hypothetical protein
LRNGNIGFPSNNGYYSDSTGYKNQKRFLPGYKDLQEDKGFQIFIWKLLKTSILYDDNLDFSKKMIFTLHRMRYNYYQKVYIVNSLLTKVSKIMFHQRQEEKGKNRHDGRRKRE